MKKSRRDFLKLMSSYAGLGMSTSAFGSLVDVLMTNTINEALAAGPSSSTKYLYIQEYGAPERWVFDLFLDPYQDGNLVGLPLEGAQGKVNKQIVNCYAGGSSRYTDAIYKFANVKGLKLPYLWSLNTGSASGAPRPIADLLDNMLSIRGVNVGNSIHTLASALQTQPSIGGHTLTGIMGASSSAPISHVAVNALYSPFQSPEGSGRLNLGANANGGTDLISKVKEPFSTNSTLIGVGDLDSHLMQKMEQFDSALGLALKNEKTLSAKAQSELKGAKSIMFDKISSMAGDYPSLRAKYLGIIANAMNIELPGINDKPVGDTNINGRGARYKFNTEVVAEADLRSMLAYGAYGSAPGDLDYMADIFAFSEFVLLNNLSSSIQVRSLPWRNLNYQMRFSSGVGKTNQPNQSFDAHNYGAMVQVGLMNSYYSCLSGCMLELIDQLKAGQIWDDTVIQLSGEFNRRPRADGTGSDHAGHASNVSLFSGKVSSPQVIGNTKASSHSTYYGSYGYAAETSDGREINLGNVASSVSQILGVKSSSPNNASLIVMQDNQVQVPSSQKAKNKAGA